MADEKGWQKDDGCVTEGDRGCQWDHRLPAHMKWNYTKQNSWCMPSSQLHERMGEQHCFRNSKSTTLKRINKEERKGEKFALQEDFALSSGTLRKLSEE